MEEFDRRGQIRDPKTGVIKVWQPYTEHIRKDGGVFLERPVGSGNLWRDNGTAAGRILANRQIDQKAKHQVVVTPMSKVEERVAALDDRESVIAKREADLISAEAQRVIVEKETAISAKAQIAEHAKQKAVLDKAAEESAANLKAMVEAKVAEGLKQKPQGSKGHKNA